jgi:(R,R)-butanediol dehydrogenase/meso-butanediol dehydrogenase/diacetyl reductase
MRQAVYTGPRTIALRDTPSAAPGPGDVLIDVSYTGVCGTDLHIFHGDMDGRVQAPVVLGHEMSGRIAALGQGVDRWAIGDPVTVMPLDWCGECPACRAGNSHVCQRLNFIGIDSPGAMQQSWTVPAQTLIRLPESLSLRTAALVEPTAVAVHDVRRAGLRPNETALVVGGGPIGLLIALVARSEGADVVVAEVNARRRARAESLGFTTLDPLSTDVTGWIDNWTDTAGVDVTFEVSGAAAGVETAVDAMRVRGRLCLVAIHPRPQLVNLHRFFWRELTLVGARLYRAPDFERAVELLNTGVIPAPGLITREVPLADAAAAFAELEAGEGVMKILVDCQRGGMANTVSGEQERQ